MPRSSPIRGRAMLTTVESRNAIPDPRTVAMMTHRPWADLYVRPASIPHLCRPLGVTHLALCAMALVMTTTVWDRLQSQANDAVRGDDVDPDLAARRLLAMCGGDQRMVLATRVRLSAIAARTPDALNPRRAVALVDRAIALAESEGLWHPVFSAVGAWNVANRAADS